MYNYNNEFQNEFESYEFNPEFLAPGSNEFEFEFNQEFQGEILNQEGTFGEATQMELASELLAVSNEYEMDQFLGKLFKKAVGGVSNFVKSPAGQALGGILKNVAKKALPIAGGAIGTALLPGVGTAIGGALGNAASNMFELELEGLSQEDREFETAKAFVRFAGNAAKNAANSRSNQPSRQVAQNSAAKAARRYAPGLIRRHHSSGSDAGYAYIAQRLDRIEDMLRNMSSPVQSNTDSNQDFNMNGPEAPAFEW